MSVNASNTTLSLLRQWLKARLDESENLWLDEQFKALEKPHETRALNLSLALCARRIADKALALSDDEFTDAQASCSGWQPRHWRLVQVARVALLLSSEMTQADDFMQRITQLFATADIDELIAYYQGLALFSHATALHDQARECLRSNMVPVFEAIAHNNAYPAKYFDENSWNQMVLKSLFLEVPLYLIAGFDERYNPDLSRMLFDYARERQAASRRIAPELWRACSPDFTCDIFREFSASMQQASAQDQQAFALLIHHCPHKEQVAIKQAVPYFSDVLDPACTWESVGQNFANAANK